MAPVPLVYRVVTGLNCRDHPSIMGFGRGCRSLALDAAKLLTSRRKTTVDSRRSCAATQETSPTTSSSRQPRHDSEAYRRSSLRSRRKRVPKSSKEVPKLFRVCAENSPGDTKIHIEKLSKYAHFGRPEKDHLKPRRRQKTSATVPKSNHETAC